MFVPLSTIRSMVLTKSQILLDFYGSFKVVAQLSVTLSIINWQLLSCKHPSDGSVKIELTFSRCLIFKAMTQLLTPF